MTPTQNAPSISNLASAAWTAAVLYAASFVDLPGDQGLASTLEAAVVALLIALPVWAVGRYYVQRNLTDPKPRQG